MHTTAIQRETCLIFLNSGLKPIFHWKWGSRWLPNTNEIYTKKRTVHGQCQNFALGPNATYIPLTDVGGWRRG